MAGALIVFVPRGLPTSCAPLIWLSRNRLVDAMRPDVTHFEHPRRQEFILRVQIVLIGQRSDVLLLQGLIVQVRTCPICEVYPARRPSRGVGA
jgi:hypothetical protein